MTYRKTFRPDSMTAEQHDEFLAELAVKYPAPVAGIGAVTITSYKDCTDTKSKNAFLRYKLATDLSWACRGVVKIHQLQTESEKNMEETTESNGIGFSGFDARGMSYMAGWIVKGMEKYRKTYANAIDKPKFIRKLHKTMPRYANQLRQIADGTLKIPA